MEWNAFFFYFCFCEFSAMEKESSNLDRLETVSNVIIIHIKIMSNLFTVCNLPIIVIIHIIKSIVFGFPWTQKIRRFFLVDRSERNTCTCIYTHSLTPPLHQHYHHNNNNNNDDRKKNKRKQSEMLIFARYLPLLLLLCSFFFFFSSFCFLTEAQAITTLQRHYRSALLRYAFVMCAPYLSLSMCASACVLSVFLSVCVCERAYAMPWLCVCVLFARFCLTTEAYIKMIWRVDDDE